MQQQQPQQQPLLLYGWRRATEYVRHCNARFVASPLDATQRRLTLLDVTATVRRSCWYTIDVQLLKRKGIIVDLRTEPNDVVTGLGKVVQIGHIGDADTYYLLPIQQELERRYNSTVHSCLSWFHVSFWTKPRVLTLITILLAVAALFYAAITYHHPTAAAAAPAPHRPSGRH